MGVEGLSFDRGRAIDLLSKVANPENKQYVKQLSQSERRVVQTVLISLYRGDPIKMNPEKAKILASVVQKFGQATVQKTGAQKVISLVKSTWLKVFGYHDRISTKQLQAGALKADISVKIQQAALERRKTAAKDWPVIAKFANQPEFTAQCTLMKNYYQNIANAYKVGGRDEALAYANSTLERLREWQPNSATESVANTHLAIVRQLEIPVLENQIKMLLEGASGKELRKEWSTKIDAWSKPSQMQSRIDRRAGLTQPNAMERMEWYATKNAGFREIQHFMSDAYKGLQGEPIVRNDNFPGGPAFRYKMQDTLGQIVDMMAELEDVHGIEAQARYEVLDRAFRELSEIDRLVNTGESDKALKQLNVGARHWETIPAAQDHLLNVGRPTRE